MSLTLLTASAGPGNRRLSARPGPESVGHVFGSAYNVRVHTDTSSCTFAPLIQTRSLTTITQITTAHEEHYIFHYFGSERLHGPTWCVRPCVCVRVRPCVRACARVRVWITLNVHCVREMICATYTITS